MAIVDPDTIYQHADDKDLLSAALAECEQLLWDLEHLMKDRQQQDNSDITNKIDLVRAQKLLYERLIIGERIDSLVILINHYANKAGQLGVRINGAIPT